MSKQQYYINSCTDMCRICACVYLYLTLYIKKGFKAALKDAYSSADKVELKILKISKKKESKGKINVRKRHGVR